MRLLAVILAIVVLQSCSIPPPLIDQIKEKGELIVITRNSPTTYYEDGGNLKGLEHDLVKLFADALGVKVRFLVPESFDEIIPMVARGAAHFAAAGLTITPERETLVRFSPSYQEVTQQLIYRSGRKRPKDIEDIAGGLLEVVAGSSHEEELVRLKTQHPGLNWIAQPKLDSEELLYLVKEQIIDYTIADSNEASLSRRFHPELKVAFDLTGPQPLAWAFPHSEDSTLYDSARAFLDETKSSGGLDQLLERYYGHVDRLGFVDTRNFKRHLVQRLPPLLPFFKEASKESGLEWQLLAAIGYQESHWNPNAVSPTGVKGVMMLTKATAKQLGIKDRTDPRQSILGGARYARIIEKKIPKRIPDPDRLWLALAGYNIGFGHLEDARILTQRHKDDPDKWSDVKKYLPLLSQKKYYKTLKRGFARGREPVKYVDNIRGYYELLMWNENQENERQKAVPNLLTTTPAPL